MHLLLQGWRLEVKSYPILTQKGAWRSRGTSPRYGGFYTQDEVRLAEPTTWRLACDRRLKSLIADKHCSIASPAA